MNQFDSNFLSLKWKVQWIDISSPTPDGEKNVLLPISANVNSNKNELTKWTNRTVKYPSALIRLFY